jgi:sodium-dependent phosphate cotransporter
MEESRDVNLGARTTLQTQNLPPALELPEKIKSPTIQVAWWERIRVGKFILFMASLFLFTLAITLMKDGARSLAPLLQNSLIINNATNCLGFGWLLAYLIMSGSPVAAASLAFFDAGVIEQMGAFAMITGSRFGASFIVLFIGFLYVLRGRDRSTSLSMGLLSLMVTFTTYLPGFILGVYFLRTGWLNTLQPHAGALLHSIIDLAVAPLADVFAVLLPDWAIFFMGLGVILLSFNLFDRCLPQMTLKDSQFGRMSRLVYRPCVMFLLGALITMISMSVSLSLSILVPLSARGFVRRENVIPYIMGANVTTFIDTLLAAVLLRNSSAFTVILVGILSIAVISILILITIYDQYRSVILSSVAWITDSNRNLGIFMVFIFILPVLLLLIR